MLSNRPKLSPELRKFDKVVNILGWISFAGFLASILSIYDKLPDVIPIHYSLSGEADRWSSKSEVWTLIAVVGIVFSLLTFFAHRPRLFNIPVRITKANAQIKYDLVARMIRITRLTITLFFLGFIWIVFLEYNSYLSWLITIGVVVIIFPVFYYYWKLLSDNT